MVAGLKTRWWFLFSNIIFPLYKEKKETFKIVFYITLSLKKTILNPIHFNK